MEKKESNPKDRTLFIHCGFREDIRILHLIDEIAGDRGLDRSSLIRLMLRTQLKSWGRLDFE